MNVAGADELPLLMTTSCVPLKTGQVGSCSPRVPPGRATLISRLPAPSYAVAVCVALFATQIGLSGDAAIPHGLMRVGSLTVPMTAPFETIGVITKVLGMLGGPGIGGGIGVG